MRKPNNLKFFFFALQIVNYGNYENIFEGSVGVKICTNITLIIPLRTLIPGKIPEFIYKIGNLRGFFYTR